MDNESWPKNGKSSSFIPFEIQRKFNMPDFHSSTSIIRQQKLLDSLSTAARHIIYSYSVNKNDLLLTFTSMIDFKVSDDQSCNDPDWYLLPFLNHNTRIIEEDTPKTQNNEYLAGGTNTVQSYITDPFSAFAKGRLLVKPLNRFMAGIGPLLRGSLIHDSLAELYSTMPSLKDIQSWSEKEKQSRIEKAVNEIFNKEIRGSNSILKRIFELEKSRAETILYAFLMEEVKRDYFQINEVEKKLTFTHANLNLHLRVDRVDLQEDDTIHVIDYKTGAAKNIIDMNNNIVSLIHISLVLDRHLSRSDENELKFCF
jgi:ATP-dependent helicase/DNAse subunit B